MNRWVFISIVSLLYLSAFYSGYKAWYIFSNEDAQEKTEKMVVFNANGISAQNDMDEPFNVEKDRQEAEMLGYIAATVAFVLLPTLMIGFKRRLIK